LTQFCSYNHRTPYNMMDEENLFVGVAWVTSTDHFDEYNNCSHEGTKITR
jgi:hypothetical protein